MPNNIASRTIRSSEYKASRGLSSQHWCCFHVRLHTLGCRYFGFSERHALLPFIAHDTHLRIPALQTSTAPCLAHPHTSNLDNPMPTLNLAPLPFLRGWSGAWPTMSTESSTNDPAVAKAALHHAPQLSTLLESGRYSDLTVTCGKRSWKVHKGVLCLQSDFFAKACDGGFKVSVFAASIPDASADRSLGSTDQDD
jgi:hypothetical protein